MKLVDIRQLKTFAIRMLPVHSTLRGIILTEADVMNASEFLVKVDIWLKLLRLETIKQAPDGKALTWMREA